MFAGSDERRGVGAYEAPEETCADCGDTVGPTPCACHQGLRECACGRKHGGAEWLALRLRGYSGRRDTGREWEALELRECHCGAVLGVVVRWLP